MRKWLVIFMLFLLPIRGLVGDAMAYSMLLDATNTANSVTTLADSVPADPVFNTAKVTEASANPPCHTGSAEMDDADSAKSQCTACQACHFSALTDMRLEADLLHIAAVRPVQHATRWHSAEPRLLAKTPVF